MTSLTLPRGNEVAGAALEPFRLIGKTLANDELVLFEAMDHLSANPKRFDWEDICILYDRVESLAANRMTMEQCGALGIQAPKFKRILQAAAAVTSPMRLYTLGNRFGLSRTFSHLSVEQTELKDGTLRVEIRIPETHRDSPGFFKITRGIMQALPKLLGMRPTYVDLEIEERRGVFMVRVPRSQTVAARFARGVRAAFAGQRALEQLDEQQIELNEHYERLQAAYVEVQAALEVKRRFMSIMSHELRTPLNGIIGSAAALRYEREPSVRSELHNALDTSAGSLARLVDGVLELSRSNGAARPVEVDVDLVALIEDAVVPSRAACEQAGLQFQLRIDPSARRRVACDGPRIAQVLDHLLDNAVKFTNEGHVRLEVSFEDDRLRATVSDTGIGIPEDRRADVFKLFMQVDDCSTRAHGGAGLGLALVQQQICVMQATLDLCSKVGDGTVVVIDVPARAVTVPQPADLDAHAPTRILVVDDNRVNRLVVGRMLKRLEWEVFEAEDGAEAVELAARLDFAAILMDCEMPVMNGWEATAKIRAGSKKAPPIIAITAYVSDEDRERCRIAGMCDFLPKPVSPGAIERALTRWTLETSASA